MWNLIKSSLNGESDKPTFRKIQVVILCILQETITPNSELVMMLRFSNFREDFKLSEQEMHNEGKFCAWNCPNNNIYFRKFSKLSSCPKKKILSHII